MGNRRAAGGYPQNAGVLVVLVNHALMSKHSISKNYTWHWLLYCYMSESNVMYTCHKFYTHNEYRKASIFLHVLCDYGAVLCLVYGQILGNEGLDLAQTAEVLLMIITVMSDTVVSFYNSVSIVWNTPNKHLMAYLRGQGIECLIWVQSPISILCCAVLNIIWYLIYLLCHNRS